MYDTPAEYTQPEIKALDPIAKRELLTECFSRLREEAQALLLRLAALHFAAVKRATAAPPVTRHAARILQFRPAGQE